jgi:hypothetical protein
MFDVERCLSRGPGQRVMWQHDSRNVGSGVRAAALGSWSILFLVIVSIRLPSLTDTLHTECRTGTVPEANKPVHVLYTVFAPRVKCIHRFV